MLAGLGVDPVGARDAYVSVAAGFEPALSFALRSLPADRRSISAAALVADILAGARSRLAMFSSCAWFWEDPSRQETIAVLRYAADAVACALRTSGIDLEPGLLADLAAVYSARSQEDGIALYRRAGGR